MRFSKMQSAVLPAACFLSMLVSASVIGQSAKATKTDTMKSTVALKQLKPQTTCPVLGDPIDKSQYVDYNGKRIYVCCSMCVDSVKKDPEKYIRKLESMGQGVETINGGTKDAGRDVKADTSMRGMKMPGDTVAKDARAGHWTCTMHPGIHKTEPGNCPICGMKLVFKAHNPQKKGTGTKSDTSMKNMDMKGMEM